VFREPVRKLSNKEVEQMDLKYYNTDIHKAAFILPEFARKVRYMVSQITVPFSV
jgi:spermidine synthase